MKSEVAIALGILTSFIPKRYIKYPVAAVMTFLEKESRSEYAVSFLLSESYFLVHSLMSILTGGVGKGEKTGVGEREKGRRMKVEEKGAKYLYLKNLSVNETREGERIPMHKGYPWEFDVIGEKIYNRGEMVSIEEFKRRILALPRGTVAKVYLLLFNKPIITVGFANKIRAAVREVEEKGAYVILREPESEQARKRLLELKARESRVEGFLV